MAAYILLIGQFYLYIGGLVAVVFLLWGADRVEPNLRGSWLVRPMLVPGTVLLWPLVLWRWARLEKGRVDPCARHLPPRGGQDLAALMLALLIPVVLFGALVLRQDGPVERPATLLEAPQ
ncbi:hypothetical protein [Meridianimarinicoccus sp. MJW13]|uniref:hypothetical protein n=1 Tax=Meridianimarinicoccus sp. MJW13 TaxID=2720031 RepID=UPI001D0070AE|nr:hypothetical protein [Fluviibacterium sp. MJW13]